MRGPSLNTPPATVRGLDVDVVSLDRDLAAEWDALAVAAGAGIFGRPGWSEAWAEAYAGGELHCVTARAPDRLVGILPVVRRGRTLRSVTNNETPRYPPVVAQPDVLGGMVSHLRDRRYRLVLEFLPAGAEAVDALRSSVPALVREIRRSPFLATTGESYDSWSGRRMSKRYQTNHRRMERRLREQGSVTFVLEDGREHLDELLLEGFSVESSGWKGELGTDVLSRDDARRLYTAAARWAAREGSLRLAFLRLDGRAVAFAYVLRDGGVMSVLKLAFDEELKKCGPGLLLVQYLLQEAFGDEGVARLDFLGEADRFKNAVADDGELQIRMDIFAPGLVGATRRAALDAMWRTRRELAARVPAETRTRIDAGNPRAAARSLLALARQRRATRRRPDDSTAER